MLWIILITMFIIVIGKFLWDRSKMERKILQQGGMKKKFQILIDLILEQDSRARIYKETPTFISVVLSSIGGTILIEILVTFSSVTITYKTDSPLFGRHKLDWEFSEDEDQEFMFEKMNKDIGAYMKKVNLDEKIETSVGKEFKKYLDDN